MGAPKKAFDSGIFTTRSGVAVDAARPEPSGHVSAPPASTSDTDLLDVPAAVVCASCGFADCLGCLDERSRSGIVSIVAWERTHLGFFARLWPTALHSTRDAPAFFEVLPDGPVVPALRFAVAAELLAVGSILATFLPTFVALFPGFLDELQASPDARAALVRFVAVGWPLVSLLLVLAHVVHGLGVAWGAARNGAPLRLTRALRFGFYSAGWDLAMTPLGAVLALASGGFAELRAVVAATPGLPTRATRGFLRGTYRLEGDAAQSALRFSYIGAAVATMAATTVVVAVCLAAIL